MKTKNGALQEKKWSLVRWLGGRKNDDFFGQSLSNNIVYKKLRCITSKKNNNFKKCLSPLQRAFALNIFCFGWSLTSK